MGLRWGLIAENVEELALGYGVIDGAKVGGAGGDGWAIGLIELR